MEHPYNQILLFGDSITQFSFDTELRGFGASLANAYQRKVDVVNRGFSGYNTEWALPILRQLLPTLEKQKHTSAKVLLATIFLGANDSALPFALQHVPLDKFKANLNAMLSMIQSPDSSTYNPELRLILITPPPLNEVQWKKRCDDQGGPLNRTWEYSRDYAQAVRDVAQEHKVVVADLWQTLMDFGTDHMAEYLLDGLHLNAKGNQVMYELLIETIKRHFPEIHPDNLEMELPGFRDLPRENFDDLLQFRLLRK
ncbi:GDSL Lipase/Acylhydrolase [Zychaea mexicana]|uniref:GDSL Lipase/Acylhydrolase n=1 Tax=Zychaea mexicana TaxID=64656 RepID=UPI0022FF2C78|nr:GDSL Lipase/Acylhydrolase [Zychaea mexicana]KAI9495538.1 GDSL Lipase/Acylhydrolase [Zychaea mexicana]